jgi:hypothetical protein
MLRFAFLLFAVCLIFRVGGFFPKPSIASKASEKPFFEVAVLVPLQLILISEKK